jgi:hypothetical protein
MKVQNTAAHEVKGTKLFAGGTGDDMLALPGHLLRQNAPRQRPGARQAIGKENACRDHADEQPDQSAHAGRLKLAVSGVQFCD